MLKNCDIFTTKIKKVNTLAKLLSNIILKFRFDHLIFSTDLLKKKLPIQIQRKSTFNFIFYSINNNKMIKKKILKIKI